MLGSKQLADTIGQGLARRHLHHLGEQSDASSVIFYTNSFFPQARLCWCSALRQHGEGSTLLWGSCYPDAPDIFLSEDQFSKFWGTGSANGFSPRTRTSSSREDTGRKTLSRQSIADKALWTDRPLP